ncbi:MAG: acyltransferase [Gammaproteobacteria bacterium]|nr:acyltransferase [Gammaproteobacteria bacterium]
MRELLDKLLPKGSARRFFAASIRSHPFSGWISIIRSLYCNYALTKRLYPVMCLVGPKMRLSIVRHADASVRLHGKLIVRRWAGGDGLARISLGQGACFEVHGDFELGHGVKIRLSQNAGLYIGGKQNETASGITCNSMIMVEDSMRIGKDCIIAWDCYLTDSDWHDISYDGNKIERSIPVEIGNHVWIGHGCSVLKGAVIGAGSIVASKSTVIKGNYQTRALLAGSPAKQIKSNVDWKR